MNIYMNIQLPCSVFYQLKKNTNKVSTSLVVCLALFLSLFLYFIRVLGLLCSFAEKLSRKEMQEAIMFCTCALFSPVFLDFYVYFLPMFLNHCALEIILNSTSSCKLTERFLTTYLMVQDEFNHFIRVHNVRKV